MSVLSILAGLVPLLLFVIVDSFCGFKKGIIAAAVAATLELILSVVVLKTVDTLSVSALILVLVMGFVAWKMERPTIFKMQPVVLGLALAFILLGSYFIDRPLFTIMMTKYKSLMPDLIAQQLQNPLFLKWLTLSTLYCGFGILLQTLLVAWAAIKLNNWWWIVFRGIGLYVFFIGGALLARYHVFNAILVSY